MKVSFLGIYDVRFPYGTNDKEIEKKYTDINKFINENYDNRFGIISVTLKDNFNVQKTDQKLADKGIRFATTVDNPYILTEIFDEMDKNLGQQYVDKSKVELVLDTKA